MTAKELKEKYLKFFEKKGHKIIPSAPLVPSEKVELAGTQRVLFTTAGMHPLVSYLLGDPHPHGKRLVNIQKSLRTDDIDEVGDSWHNTFFEMLGNWSLGDYWKKEAIEWSFEFLTKELGMDPGKIHVTVFSGDKDIPGVPEDKESVEIWKGLGIPENRIFKLGKEDNWWGPVGNSGPCGPDTEMFYDTGKPEHGEKCQPGETCGKYAEIWNDVFMEFNKTAEGKYEPLKQKNVDTGMGVERTVAILQGKDNVYDTELFLPVMETIKETAKDKFKIKECRIVADHVRAACFLISDGVLPISDDDRGSILVRLIDTALTSLRELEIQVDLVSRIVGIYIDYFGEEYPEMEKKRATITDVINSQKEKFVHKAYSEETINRERKEIQKAQHNPLGVLVNNVTTISGGTVKSFEDFRKRLDSPLLTPTVSAAIGTVSADLKMTYGTPTQETFRMAEEMYKEFNRQEANAALNGMVKLHRQESGKGVEKKFAGGLADHSDITVRGHTATHLLHQALRDVLGKHVYQTGSNITPERIRFDFSHSEKLAEDQIKKVEEIVNEKIKEDLVVKKELMSQEEADKQGAIGLFREKYGDKVSIYKVGNYSVEYCGGPHVDHTAKVGNFKIIKEEALGAGQRRIRAVLN